MTTTREAFEAWFLDYRQSTWRPLKADPRKDMPAHWNVNCEMDCWRGWQAATFAERERCALVCEVNQVARAVNKGHFLVNWPIDSYGTHEGMTYAAAIRQGGDI